MSTNASDVDKDSVSTPDRDIPGLTDLSGFEEGDKLRLEGHETPLTVDDTHSETIETNDGDEYTAHAVLASHDRTDARQYDLAECINTLDGSVIEIVDKSGRGLRVFEVGDDE